MKDGLVRTLLAIAAVLSVTLILGGFSGPARGLALCGAALVCLAACRIRWQHGSAVHTPLLPDELVRTWSRLWSRAMEWMRPGGQAAHATEKASSLSYGVCVLDREYHVLWCNAASAAHLGMRSETAIGRPFNRADELAAYVAAGDFGKPLQLEDGGGGDAVLEVSLVPYLKSQWLLLSRDVTLDTRSEMVRRDGVADALHELCTPVTVLAGYVDTVRRFRPDSRRARECYRSMEEQCRRMQRIIEDLLDLWTLDSAPVQPRHERVDVYGMLSGIRDDMEALAGGRLRITLEAQPGLELLGSEEEILSAFSNLATNAVRYTPAGEVRLTWRALTAGAEFAVEDTGIGIAAEHIPRLTDRFFRVDRDYSRRRGGTGLGLAIVKDVLALHQATLQIDSKPGVGSRFAAQFPAHRVLMPAMQPDSADDAIAGAEPRGAQPAGVLLPFAGSGSHARAQPL